MTTKNKLNYDKKVRNYMYCQLPPPKGRGFLDRGLMNYIMVKNDKKEMLKNESSLND